MSSRPDPDRIRSWQRVIAAAEWALHLPGAYPLSALCLLLVLASGSAAWIDFPLSGSRPGNDLPVGHALQRELSISEILSGIAGLGLLFLFRQPAAALCLYAGALALILSVPLTFPVSNPDWIGTYLWESTQRNDLTQFMGEYFIPNENHEPSYVPVYDFEFLPDLWRTSFYMLGVGWFWAFTGIVILLLIARQRLASPWALPLAGAATLVFAAVLSAPALWTLLAADHRQRKADSLMQEQRSGAALAAYDAVLKMTPVYAYSDTFLTKCSRAYDALSAGRHPYGRLLALRKTVSSPLSQSQGQSQAMLRPSLEVARTELREIQAIPPSKPVERALADLGRRLEVTAWVQEGLADTGAGRLNMALRSFARAYQLRPELSTAFFLARTYFVLGDENAAIEMLLRLQEDVANPMVRADMVCTLGDAYSNLGRLRLARHYYSLCETTDDEDNFRAIRALTGGGK